jgi:hypothetical protein
MVKGEALAYPPCEAKLHGEGDRTKCGGGADGAAGPSTGFQPVPLPIACGDREDWI